MRHDGNTTTDRDAQLVERRRLPSSEVSEVGERDLAPRLRRLIRLVDDGDPIGIDSDRSVEEITDGQRMIMRTPGLGPTMRPGRSDKDG